MFDGEKQEYIKRVNYVLDFIEDHLNADLSLEKLAQKAHYSPYHFHRVFLTVVGENLNEYINRKRIERIASVILVDSKVSLKELAFTYGFNSDSSFSRAFKKYYGVSPTKFKSEGKHILSKIGIESFSLEKYICNIENIKKWIAMNAQISVKKLKTIQLAGITNIGGFDKMETMFQKIMEWGHKEDVLNMSNFKAITIYHDNTNVTEASRVRFSTCVAIKKSIKSIGEIKPFKISKGAYAVGNFVIDGKDFPKAWKSMFVWIIENGYKFRDGDYFEEYLNDHKTHPQQKNIVNICVPVEKNNAGNTKENYISTKPDYHELIGYMKKIKAFFQKEYTTEFKLGNIYQGNKNYSYFSITTEELKKLKLKFVIVFDHIQMCFNICLSGQNKSIRKKYWNIFKNSDWTKYQLVTSIEGSLAIIEYTMVEQPTFGNINALVTQIESESLKFIQEIRNVLEA